MFTNRLLCPLIRSIDEYELIIHMNSISKDNAPTTKQGKTIWRVYLMESVIFAMTWWRHQMETFSALLAICAGNSTATGEFTAQRPVTRSFDVFFDLHLHERLSKQSWGWWFETPSRPLWRYNNESGILDCAVSIAPVRIRLDKLHIIPHPMDMKAISHHTIVIMIRNYS